jgi:hypothetical protein
VRVRTLTSLLPPITRDVAMGGVVTKEKAITRSRYLDLVYSQFGMLYGLILQAPLPSNNTTIVPPT